jgi:hypothetical protein
MDEADRLLFSVALARAGAIAQAARGKRARVVRYEATVEPDTFCEDSPEVSW